VIRSKSCSGRAQALPPVPVPPARPVLRATSAGSGTPVTTAPPKPLRSARPITAQLSAVALQSRPLQPRQRLKEKHSSAARVAPEGLPSLPLLHNRGLCKLWRRLRSLRPYATSDGPAHDPSAPQGAPFPCRGAPSCALPEAARRPPSLRCLKWAVKRRVRIISLTAAVPTMTRSSTLTTSRKQG